jgi:hypothetical protein
MIPAFSSVDPILNPKDAIIHPHTLFGECSFLWMPDLTDMKLKYVSKVTIHIQNPNKQSVDDA